MNVNTFMNTIKECAEVEVGNLDQDVLNEFTYGPNFKLDEEMEEQLIVKAYKALKAAK